MSSHYRSSSPGGRRITNNVNPARMSDSAFYTTTTTYPSPRGSTERVIPISTTTFINAPRTSERLDAYTTTTTRPRRSTLTEQSRPLSSHTHTHLHAHAPSHSHSHSHSRTRPAIVQTHAERPSSPPSRPNPSRSSHEPTHKSDYYVTPASSSAPRREHMHRKVYSIDDGKSHLVADIDLNPTRPSRRSSVERNPYRTSTAAHTSSHRNSYHLSGPLPVRQDPVDIDSGFSYTDPAGMYRDTEPRRRRRAGSVEGVRKRPTSMVMDPFPTRSSGREPGPPTSRALDRYNGSLGQSQAQSQSQGLGGLHRGGSLRDTPRSSNHALYQESPSTYTSPVYQDALAPYTGPAYQEHHSAYTSVPPQDRYASAASTGRHPSVAAAAAIHQERTTDRRDTHLPPRETQLREPYDDRRDMRKLYEDRSIERRGFGIKHLSPERRAPARSSDETLGRREPYLERIMPQPQSSSQPQLSDPRDVVRTRSPRDDSRRAQERRDYEYAKEIERQERERLRIRDQRDQEWREKERTPDDLVYPSERDRERLRAPRDSTVHRETDRDRRDYDRRNPPARGSPEAHPSVLPAAIGGLGAAAAAAAVYGSGEVTPKSRDREKDRGRQSPPDSDRDEERSRRRRNDQRETRTVDGASPPDRERRVPASDRVREPEKRTASSDTPAQPPIDPDEEYRRRVQQAQREIATASNGASSREPAVPDATYDGEYRRHERSERSDRAPHRDSSLEETPPSRSRRRSPEESDLPSTSAPIDRDDSVPRDTRVRIVDPPSKNDEQPPIKGILRRPTEKFPEDPHPIREGVAPLKDVSKEKDIPLDARWTKINRGLVNPECLEEAKERFEEREDSVIVLRVLTRDEIQGLANRTAQLRHARYLNAERERARHERRRIDKEHDRRDRDEYSDHSEDEYAPRKPRLLEGPASGQESQNGFVKDRRGDMERVNREAGGG